ncbi:TM2 domain-containing membrane protein YozV [Evansella vedderi]|uniref:TM2 domain-containing membrane protein YozV n=1 Tax=Evansella vedderi TaxID=38282 RepID=A0ABT9ZNS8_9BACI|nr:hypothetical protein [Evansella vedderi]MDQ0252844.1 TM2 domain-containing membrane protein YozV [Evansella vedderi]
MKRKPKKHEALLWSIALPGFGQFLNGKIVKGIVLILLEFIVNIQSNFNLTIMLSFMGEINKAIETPNYQWLMFYPCLYMFSIWDAYRDAEGDTSALAYLPFVFGAFFITIGLIYSTKLTLFGIKLGPVFLPMTFLIPGLLIGYIIKSIATTFINEE